MDVEIYKSNIIPCSTEIIENSSICSSCGGRCCNTCSCHISPKDVKDLTVDGLYDWIVKSKCIAIDWWEGDTEVRGNLPKIYFLRMRHKDTGIIDPTYGGKCVLLSEDGCTIDWAYRGKGARDLVPHESFKCGDRYSKYDCASDWREYYDILKEVVDKITETFENETTEQMPDLDTLLKIMLGV